LKLFLDVHKEYYVFFEYIYKRELLNSFMADEDRSTRLKINLINELDELEFVRRKDSYSKTIQSLVDFYKDNKEEFKKWQKKQTKKT